MQRPDHALARWLASQRGGLAEWVPVCLGLGVGGYFQLPFEPGAAHWVALITVLVVGVLVSGRINADLRPILTAFVLIGMGLLLGGLRTHLVEGPILTGRYYGPVQGRILSIDKSASDAVRLTLDQVQLSRHQDFETPRKIRISLHGPQGYFEPAPGQVIAMTGHLSPPSGPVEPGGFDFQRQAYFRGLGGVGYTRTPALLMAQAPQSGAALWVQRVRLQAATAIRAYLPGATGAFAAAIMTGDRSALPPQVTRDLRAANLSHLLAISGLHMGLLTGFVFLMARSLLALWPRYALRHDSRKLAALLALLAGGAYLALSGGNVATLRAFIMVGVMYVAVLIGRRAVTLRAVAVAATIILVLTPEAMIGPGFQMSFAATTALVAVFGWVQTSQLSRYPRLVRVPALVFLSSFTAGLATAPVAAAHFNRVASFGLIANLATVPLMGLVVMPGAVVAALLAPFGLGGLGLMLMSPAIDWILTVAHTVAGWPGAVRYVVVPQPFVLPVFALGALWVVLVRGTWRSRWQGAVVATSALLLWTWADRPEVLVSDQGGLVGAQTEQGRALSKPKGESFVAMQWLENDGDGADQPTAFARSGLAGTRTFKTIDDRLAHVTGRDGGRIAAEACTQFEIVVTSARVQDAPENCTMLDAGVLAKTGAVAIWFDEGTTRMVTVQQSRGTRPWTGGQSTR